jgi:tetratricopeptide (TPR) repeat protein
MAPVIADHARHDRANHLLDQAERAAAALTEPASRFQAFYALAAASATLDDCSRAATAIARARIAVDELDGPNERAGAAAALARSAVDAGCREHAEALYRTAERHLVEIGDPEQEGEVLRELVATLAALGRYEQAEAVAARIGHVSVQSFALTEAARIAAAGGQLDLAERLANNVVQLDERVKALAAVVRAVGTADPDRADRLTDEAQRAARENVWVLCE